MTSRPKPKQGSEEIFRIEPEEGYDFGLIAGMRKKGRLTACGSVHDWTKDELKPHTPRRTDLTIAKMIARALGAKI